MKYRYSLIGHCVIAIGGTLKQYIYKYFSQTETSAEYFLENKIKGEWEKCKSNPQPLFRAGLVLSVISIRAQVIS